jgi:hypothetical protein
MSVSGYMSSVLRDLMSGVLMSSCSGEYFGCNLRIIRSMSVG